MEKQSEPIVEIALNYTRDMIWDLVERFEVFFKSGGMYLREDNRVGVKIERVVDSPWLYVAEDETRFCPLYHKVFFPALGIIHSRCLNCWKVVTNPRTVLELVRCYNIQKRIGTMAKCGIEIRDYVPANYGCYWYNDTLGEGLDKKAEVKEELEKEGIDIPVILKRGCTEFEQKMPNPNTWGMVSGQEEYEDFLQKTLVLETDPTLDIPWG